MASDRVRLGLDGRAFSVLDTYKMSAAFQSLLALGLGKPFPLSVIYVAFIYAIAITAILCAGLCFYLAMTGNLNLRRLRRGALLILIAVVPSLHKRNVPQQNPAFACRHISSRVDAVGFCFVNVDTSAALRAQGIAIVNACLESVPRNYCKSLSPLFVHCSQ